jgi:hypothetical protein
MMRLVIIKDGTVGVSGQFIEGLDLSQCGLPENFWALQWEERGANSGHIEYDSPLIDNTPITELPAWANACIAVWQAEVDRLAAAAAAQAEQQPEGGN